MHIIYMLVHFLSDILIFHCHSTNAETPNVIKKLDPDVENMKIIFKIHSTEKK